MFDDARATRRQARSLRRVGHRPFPLPSSRWTLGGECCRERPATNLLLIFVVTRLEADIETEASLALTACDTPYRCLK